MHQFFFHRFRRTDYPNVKVAVRFPNDRPPGSQPQEQYFLTPTLQLNGSLANTARPSDYELEQAISITMVRDE